MIKRKHLLYCFLLFCALAFANFALDALCQSAVGDGEKELIGGVVSLRYAKNAGMAFSLLSDRPLLANVLSAAVIAAIAAYMLFGKMALPARLSLSAVLTGGACNLYMRLVHGGVNDWINLEFVRYPLFNFADICVCVGMVLFIVFTLFAKEKPENAD